MMKTALIATALLAATMAHSVTNSYVTVDSGTRAQTRKHCNLTNPTNNFGGFLNASGLTATNGAVRSLIGGEDDLRVPITSVKVAGAKQPGWEQWIGGLYSWAFSAAREEEAYFNCQLSHVSTNATIRPHVHFNQGDTTSTNPVVWGLEFTFARIGMSFDATPVIITATQEVLSANEYTHYLTMFSEITVTGTTGLASAMLGCRIFRDHDDPADTNPNDMFLQEIDFHFEITNPFGLEGDY